MTITAATREPAEKLKEIAVWYHEHRRDSMDIDKRWEFQMRAIDHILWLQTYIIEAIQKVEGRKDAQRLFLPNGIRMEANLRTPGS